MTSLESLKTAVQGELAKLNTDARAYVDEIEINLKAARWSIIGGFLLGLILGIVGTHYL